jgi:NAD(P)-dependent dehydrogenase (short-subunit alcohol dehydrogenase family)
MTEYAMVTGAASGMGRATAEVMQAAGWSLLLVDLDARRLEAVCAELREHGPVDFLAGDLTDAAFIEQLLKTMAERGTSAVVHCAGISPTMGVPARILDVNLAATIALVDGLVDVIADSAAVVLFASSAAHMIATTFDEQISQALGARDLAPLYALASSPELAYAISKRGVLLLARNRATSFGKRNMRINSISPGLIDTPMSRAEMVQQPMMETMLKNSPLPRLALPQEVGKVAAFLCGPDASFITGTDILVDGGVMTVGLDVVMD